MPLQFLTGYARDYRNRYNCQSVLWHPEMPIRTWSEYTARIEKKANRIKRKLSIAINTALSAFFKKWGNRKK